ncbi:MAG: formylmethanofuran dehydrogenase subunit E family protein [Candidatus Omnitrophota bacterium]|nr:formylmethanofuran dehydrogenase subunit E family protein [Candidatus Omnitrophota bacterium]
MGNNRIMLNEAVKFHGHLGPYLVLGILAGELAIKRLRCKKYFDLKVKVWGANRKPKSCLIDGLQLSTGATYGKGNIHKLDGRKIKIEFCNSNNNKEFILRLTESLIQRLEETKTHRDSELLAKRLYEAEYNELFNLTPNT